MAVPIITIMAGRSNSGKTTLLLSLLPELARRQIRVGVIKHGSHFDLSSLEQPDKDSGRLLAAGVAQMVLTSPERTVRIEHYEEEPDLNRLAASFHHVDLILAEGYKNSNWPKIEIMRRGHNTTLYAQPEELLAVVGDMPEVCPAGILQLSFNDTEAICDAIEKYIKTFSG